MSVEPLDSMSDLWTKWQGHVVNGTHRIGRYVGGSEHSGVYVTLLGQQQPVEVALKLIPASAASVSQLPDLRTAAGLAHPNLIRLLKTGRCELEGQPFLYVVMEYAEQSLAQILRSRPLTEDEAREMLVPMLNALAFLHGRNLVQGQLKPTNILAVGDKLKLASDTIRPISEGGAGRSILSAYDPPEYREGGYSTAGDIWGLGMSLLEALSRRGPAGLDDGRGVVAVPPDFSPAFRDIVVQCLSRRPFDRPKLTEVDSWLRRQATGAAWAAAAEKLAETDAISFELEQPLPAIAAQAARQPALAESAAAPDPAAADPAAVEPAAAQPIAAPMVAEPLRGRSARDSAPLPQAPQRPFIALMILSAAVAIALGWAGLRALSTHRTAPPPPVAAAQQAVAQPATPDVAPSGAGGTSAAAAAGSVHEEMPEVPLHARQTIHGRIKIAIRVIVDRAGNVVGARADQVGPSRYFERLAIEAAKKWTFPPADTPARRLKQIRFEFTRDGVTGRAVSLQ